MEYIQPISLEMEVIGIVAIQALSCDRLWRICEQRLRMEYIQPILFEMEVIGL